MLYRMMCYTIFLIINVAHEAGKIKNEKKTINGTTARRGQNEAKDGKCQEDLLLLFIPDRYGKLCRSHLQEKNTIEKHQ